MKTKVSPTHTSLCFLLKFAQCFGMLPVCGISGQSYRSLSFRWTAKRTLYSILFFVMALLNTALHLSKMIYLKMFHFGATVTFLFFIVTAITVGIFLDVARKWPKLMKKWTKVDNTLELFYGFPPNLHGTLKRLTVVIMTAAFVEHTLFLLFTFKYAEAGTTLEETVQLYFENRFDQIFSVIPYCLFFGIITQIVNTFSTVSWNFMDLFIIVISLVLSSRFKQVVLRIKTLTELKVSDENVWRIVREDYTSLVNLCGVVDDTISTIMLVSFGNNIFVVVVQLYYTLQRPPSNGALDKIYYMYSFSFLIIRILAIILYVARVNSESKKPQYYLNVLINDVYNIEIERFLYEVKYNAIALTGHKLFKVTKSLILNIAGAIVSYELILMQFEIA